MSAENLKEEEEGASYKEQLLDASRRNNDSLLNTIFEEVADPNKIAKLINETKDPLGNTPLHLSTQYGNYSVLDLLLDQEGVEVDPQNRLDDETPLHFAVKYTYDDFEYGKFLVELLLDVGADPRIKNKHGEKPVDLIRGDDKEHGELKDILEQAEYTALVSQHADNNDVVDKLQNLTVNDAQEADEGEESGSASPSDSDSDSEDEAGTASESAK